jgi:hypothetical protein
VSFRCLLAKIIVNFGDFWSILSVFPLNKRTTERGSPIFQQKGVWGVLILSHHPLYMRVGQIWDALPYHINGANPTDKNTFYVIHQTEADGMSYHAANFGGNAINSTGSARLETWLPSTSSALESLLFW